MGDRGESRFWRKYSPEITLLGLLVSVLALIPAFNSGSVDWPLVVLILVATLGLFCLVFAGGLCVRYLIEHGAAKKAAKEEDERQRNAEKQKEESRVRVFRNASMTALDLRRLYQAVREDDVDIDDQTNPSRQSLVTRTTNIRGVFEDEFGIAAPPLIDEKLESFNYQGWIDYLECLIAFMERGDLAGARRRFPLDQPWVPVG